MNARIAMGLIGMVAVASAAACMRAGGGDVSGAESASTSAEGGTSPALAWPKPGSTDNPLDKTAVLDAWKKVKHDFYDTADGYEKPGVALPNGKTPPQVSLPPPNGEPASCLGACPSYYSDLVCHYYCWHPSYSNVVPNVRGCFSYIARGSVRRDDLSPSRTMFYPEIYDYCLYQDYDTVLGSQPKYDQNTIDTNRAAGTRPGVLRWVDDHEREAFRYVMFTSHDPFAFDFGDQQDVINEFYGVSLANAAYGASDAADVAECNAKRPRTATDPYDGTHCSRARDPKQGHAKHPDHAAIVAYLRSLELPQTDALAFFDVQNAQTTRGTDVYVLGDAPELGAWNPAHAVKLSPTSYPRWTGALPLSRGAKAEFKFIKKDASGNVTWESGGNRSLAVSRLTSMTIAGGDAWH